ncbi:MAG: hypothetical protein IT379_39505 [Deltaproteobacteria bacterium]|nr:hypothetical protein [Deltaproteobacteria bacterium]
MPTFGRTRSGIAAPPASVTPPRLMRERPTTLDVVAGVERFVCEDLRCKLTRFDCATRWRQAGALRTSDRGLVSAALESAHGRAAGALKFAACRGCPVGAIHADELKGVRRPDPPRVYLPLVEDDSEDSGIAPPPPVPARRLTTSLANPDDWNRTDPMEPQPEEEPMSKKPATITHEGQTHTVAEWAKIKGLGESLIHYRLSRGKPPAEILAPRSASGRPASSAEKPPRRRRAPARPAVATVADLPRGRHPAIEVLELAGFVIAKQLEVPAGLLLVVGGK